MIDLTSSGGIEDRASQPGHVYVETTAKDHAQVHQGHVLHPHQYGQTYATDRAQIYQGTTFTTHNYYRLGPDEQHSLDDDTSQQPAVLKQQEKKEKKDKSTYDKLMESLAFERMDARFRNISPAMPSTVQWLFQHENFLKWARTHAAHDSQGFFWIRGKPGSGKSTILKEICSWAQHNWEDEVRLCYFYHGWLYPQKNYTGFSESKSGQPVHGRLVHRILLRSRVTSRTVLEAC